MIHGVDESPSGCLVRVLFIWKQHTEEEITFCRCYTFRFDTWSVAGVVP